VATDQHQTLEICVRECTHGLTGTKEGVTKLS
jgi:hypothetical protein